MSQAERLVQDERPHLHSDRVELALATRLLPRYTRRVESGERSTDLQELHLASALEWGVLANKAFHCDMDVFWVLQISGNEREQ